MSTIKNERTRRGMTQKELARAAGIDVRTLRKIENDEHVSEVSLACVENVLGANRSSDPQHVSKGTDRLAANLCRLMPFVCVLALAFFTFAFYYNHSSALLWFVAALSSGMLWAHQIVEQWTYLGNTEISFQLSLDDAPLTENLKGAAQEWLGRTDVRVSEPRFDGEYFRVSTYADYRPTDLPALVNRLTGLGVNFHISR